MMPTLFDMLDEHLQRRGGPLFSLEGEYRIHRDLLDVLKARDPDAARQSMREHLEIYTGAGLRMGRLRALIRPEFPRYAHNSPPPPPNRAYGGAIPSTPTNKCDCPSSV